MADSRAPYGAETAKFLYDTLGWVVHSEVNVFDRTGMKTEYACGADYPAAAAWMMQHVWDEYDYSRNVTWLASNGYPLLKGVTESRISRLQVDEYFKDGMLGVNPCTSPERGPTSFGCTHWQQRSINSSSPPCKPPSSRLNDLPHSPQPSLQASRTSTSVSTPVPGPKYKNGN